MSSQPERLTVAQAARKLGVSPEAVRKRIKRGTIPFDHDDDGLTHVYVEVTNPTEPSPDAEGDTVTSLLLESYRERVESLERSLAAEREAHSETRRIAAMLAARVPELEAETKEDPPESTGGPETSARRSWWRFWRS